ncbi:MAG: TadE/TadG family type IV pilus assembly protein, partial [Dongiaceae bacterium]
MAGVAVMKLLKKLFHDDRGAVAMYFALMTPVFILIGAVVMDLSRQDSFNTQIQNYVDAASLAGAKELDKQPGARARALEAARNTLVNVQDFAFDGPQILLDGGECPLAGAAATATDTAGCVYFLKRLPELDTDPINHSDPTDPDSDLATGDSDTRYIEVRVNRRSMNSLFINALSSPDESLDTGAIAVAGQNQVICNVPGFFMCNPIESGSNIDPEDFDEAALNGLAGTQFRAFIQSNAGGGGNSYINGNWGLICPLGFGTCGATEAKEVLASATGTCLSLDELITKPGNDLGQTIAGVNVRMDQYEPQAKYNNDPIYGNAAWRTLLDFRPALNVTQAGEKKTGGGGGAKCEYDPLPAASAIGLPRDPCFAVPNCPGYGGANPNNHMGRDPLPNGNDSPYIGSVSRLPSVNWTWDYREYFRINHGCDPDVDDVNDAACPTSIGWPDADRWPPTYFETYRFETEYLPPSLGAAMPNAGIVTVGRSIAASMITGKPASV